MDSLSRLPLYLQVKNYITSMIDSGDYPADSKLPTEKELMKTLGVGRATVRSALSELEHDGRIYKRHGVGTFVSSNKWMPAFEPIISLTYSLERLGLEIRNVIISSGLEYPKGELAKNFPQDKKIGRLSRLRLAAEAEMARDASMQMARTREMIFLVFFIVKSPYKYYSLNWLLCCEISFSR